MYCMTSALCGRDVDLMEQPSVRPLPGERSRRLASTLTQYATYWHFVSPQWFKMRKFKGKIVFGKVNAVKINFTICLNRIINLPYSIIGFLH
jgi:hypothetical protein